MLPGFESYDFYSGEQIGTKAGEGKRGIVERGNLPPLAKNFDWGALGGFITFDVTAGYKFNKLVIVGIGITNLFDIEQREFIGSPSIGRLIAFELKMQLPNSSKK